MSENSGHCGCEQAMKLGIVFSWQASCQFAPSARGCARYGLIVQCSGPSTTRGATGLPVVSRLFRTFGLG